MVSLEVRVFAALRQLVKPSLAPNPDSPFPVTLEEGKTLQDLQEAIGIAEGTVIIALVNGLRKPHDYVLQDGDRIGFFPPLGGG